MEEHLEYHNATKWGWRNKAGGSTKTGLKLGLKYKLNNQRHWGGGKWWRKTGEVNKVQQREDLIGWGDTGNRTGANEADKKKKNNKKNRCEWGKRQCSKAREWRRGQTHTKRRLEEHRGARTQENGQKPDRTAMHYDINPLGCSVSSIMLMSMNKDRIWLNNYYKRLINHDMV